jgi:transposase
MYTANLPDDPQVVNKIIAQYEIDLADCHAIILELQEQVFKLKAILFGTKSEKSKISPVNTQQLSLFDTAEFLNSSENNEEKAEPACTVREHSRKKRGRKPIPENLPRKEIMCDIPEDNKVCACGCSLKRIGEETSEKLCIVPQRVFVKRYIRPKYACPACEGTDDESPTVKISPIPPQIISKGIASPELLAQIMISKFADALPFYRQTEIFKRIGVDIPRAAMSEWALRVAAKCLPVLRILYDELRSCGYVCMDETPVQVLHEPERKNTAKSQMWVARGGPPGRIVILFHYDPSRGSNVPEKILGDNYRGYLQSDGHISYASIGNREGIVHIGCLVHVRRKFVDVVKISSPKTSSQKSGTADMVLELIRQVYRLEKEHDGQPRDVVLTMRRQQIAPILDNIETLLKSRQAKIPPKSLLGRAVNYALGQWPRIKPYLNDARLRPDNNLAENAIRPFVIGRKNWLFSGSPGGARASACLYSLIETAKANGLEPYAYLVKLFTELPYAKNADDLQRLLPFAGIRDSS